VDETRHTDFAWAGETLQASSDIDPVPIEVITLNDYVTHVDAYAELNPAIIRSFGKATSHRFLHVDGMLDSVDRTGEFNERTVSGCLNDTSPILGNLGLKKIRSKCLEPCQRASFILAHQSTVTDYVRSQYRR
jgi:hypothetical protein